MSNPVTERTQLSQTDIDIAAGERRVQEQTNRLERLRHDGHAVDQAEWLLGNLEQTLAAWKTHRDLIFQEIAFLQRISNG